MRAITRSPHALPVEQLDARIDRDRLHEQLERLAASPAQRRMRGEDLLPRVRDRGMRIHHACGELDELSGVADKQDLRIAANDRMIKGFSDII